MDTAPVHDIRKGRCHDSYIWPVVVAELEKSGVKSVFDLGCGSGYKANLLQNMGFRVCGVDPAFTDISAAREHFPHLDLQIGSSGDDLAAKFGTFPAVISIEVIEHCPEAHAFARCFYDL